MNTALRLLGMLALFGPMACNSPSIVKELPTAGSSAKIPEDCGILLIAHGGSPKWNAMVEDLASVARPRGKIMVGYLFDKYGPSVQDAYDILIAADDTSRVIAVPLMVSGHSGHAREIAELVGVADALAQIPQDVVAAEASAASHKEEAHQKIEVIDSIAPIIGLTPALNDHAILASILLDRSRALSKESANESVVLVAHGPNGAQDAKRWLTALNSMSAQIQLKGGFQKVSACLLRDDADPEILEQAHRDLRQRVEEGGQAGRALVVPVLLSQGHVVWQIPNILEGLHFAWNGRAILPDDRIADWIVQGAIELVEGQKLRP